MASLAEKVAAMRETITTNDVAHPSLAEIIIIPLVGVLLAFLMTLVLYIKVAKSEDPTGAGADKMIKIAEKIRAGSKAFLMQEYKYLTIFVLVVSIVLGLTLEFVKGADHFDGTGLKSSISFIVGAFFSASAGYMGMMIATEANVKTTQAAKGGAGALNAALKVAFAGGGVMGFVVVGLGLLGVTFFFALWAGICEGEITLNLDDEGKAFACQKEAAKYLAGFGFGASSIALFARVAGGIYTKAADVGADLVGKVEAGIPEDDPRNPGTIADNVGDNVGDVAGMGADLFESYVGSIIASMALSDCTAQIALPLWVAGAGVLASCIGFWTVRTKDGASQTDLLHSLHMGVFSSSFFIVILSLLCCGFLFHFTEADPVPYSEDHPYVIYAWWKYWLCICIGLASGIVIGEATEQATSFSYRPTKSIAEAGVTGAATVIIQGLGVGMMSCVPPCMMVVVAVMGCYTLGGVYGVAISAVGMLSTLGVTLATDAYGPVADNAGGIAEMSELPEAVRDITDALDALGNTTAATGKGFAVGSAVLTALALMTAFAQQTGVTDISLTEPIVLAGTLIGAVLPYLFASMSMLSVREAAGAIIEEVRRQFKEIDGLLEGKDGVEPEVEKCVQIATDSSLREMVMPGVMATMMPIVMGLLVGAKALGGMLAGTISSGFMVAVMMNNAGGAWDNAKKFIETQEEGRKMGGKGSDVHSACVIGDTVGDPFKDTSGPSLNILIKLMSIISLNLAPTFTSNDWGAAVTKETCLQKAFEKAKELGVDGGMSWENWSKNDSLTEGVVCYPRESTTLAGIVALIVFVLVVTVIYLCLYSSKPKKGDSVPLVSEGEAA